MDLARAEYFGAPGGIYQGDNPPPNTIRDGRNLDSSGTCWKQRPGIRTISELSVGSFEPIPYAFIDYVPDIKVPVPNSTPVLVYLYNTYTSGSSMSLAHVIRGIGKEYGLNLPRSINDRVWVSHCEATLRYVSGDTVTYYPCLLMADGNGIMRYTQYTQAGVIKELEAQNGGDSDISYLSEVPKAKIVINYKNRIFAMNCKDAPNRMYWTTVDSNRVFTANVWPAEYNLDVGEYSSPIVGAAIFNDLLIILKSDSIWALGGDGVGGLWDIQHLVAECDCIGHHTVVNIGDSLVWLGKYGVYRWAPGTRPARVSHPALQNFWAQYMNISQERSIGPAIHDEDNKRIMFPVFNPPGMLVYNYAKNTWDVWGCNDGARAVTMDSHWIDNYLYRKFPIIGTFSKGVFKGKVVGVKRIGSNDESKNKYSDIVILDDNASCDIIDADNDNTHTEKIIWWLRTQEYFVDDSDTKLLRHFVLEYSSESKEILKIIVLGKDADPTLDYLRDKGQSYGILLYENVGPFYQYNVKDTGTLLRGGVKYDALHHTVWKKIADSKSSIGSDSTSLITFATAVDGFIGGETAVVQEDTDSMIRHTISPDADLLDGNTTLLGFGINNARTVRDIIACNKYDRQFSVLITNVRDYESYYGGSNIRIHGWGLWVKPRGVLRR